MRLPSSDLSHILTHTRDLWEDLRGKRIFLTGGTGFFGCWILESFVHAVDHLKLDTRITVLTRDADRFAQKMPHLAAHASVELLKGDVRTFNFPDGNFSHIIHAATDANVTLNREDPDLMLSTIVEGTARMMEFAEACDAEKCLLTSSGAVYGRQPPTITHMPEDEEAVQMPLHTPSAYAEGKRAAEQMWRGTIARCFAFVGPHLPLDTHYAVGNFIRDGMKGELIRVNGDGTPERSYLYASDLVIWLLTILLRGEDGRAYNVGSERNLAIHEVAEMVARCFNPPTPILIAKEPVPGTPSERYAPSTLRARTELGLRETVGLEDALDKTITWYAGHTSSWVHERQTPLHRHADL